MDSQKIIENSRESTNPTETSLNVQEKELKKQLEDGLYNLMWADGALWNEVKDVKGTIFDNAIKDVESLKSLGPEDKYCIKRTLNVVHNNIQKRIRQFSSPPVDFKEKFKQTMEIKREVEMIKSYKKEIAFCLEIHNKAEQICQSIGEHIENNKDKSEAWKENAKNKFEGIYRKIGEEIAVHLDFTVVETYDMEGYSFQVRSKLALQENLIQKSFDKLKLYKEYLNEISNINEKTYKNKIRACESINKITLIAQEGQNKIVGAIEKLYQHFLANDGIWTKVEDTKTLADLIEQIADLSEKATKMNENISKVPENEQIRSNQQQVMSLLFKQLGKSLEQLVNTNNRRDIEDKDLPEVKKKIEQITAQIGIIENIVDKQKK